VCRSQFAAQRSRRSLIPRLARLTDLIAQSTFFLMRGLGVAFYRLFLGIKPVTVLCQCLFPSRGFILFGFSCAYPTNIDAKTRKTPAQPPIDRTLPIKPPF
jgi:hypothetical protein